MGHLFGQLYLAFLFNVYIASSILDVNDLDQLRKLFERDLTPS